MHSILALNHLTSKHPNHLHSKGESVNENKDEDEILKDLGCHHPPNPIL